MAEEASVTQPREQDRIQCLVCRRWYKALPRHLLRAHGLDDDVYRLRYQIPVGVPLVCLSWSERQSARNVKQGSGVTLRPREPGKGAPQRRSVRARRKGHYAALASAGTAAAALLDKTAERRERIAPYPVTAQQAADRLGCSLSAAYTFLPYCVCRGKLSRVGRGLYAP